MDRLFYIIESQTLGTLRDIDYEPWNNPTPKPRYSVTGSRTENAILYPTFEQAEETYNLLVDNKARGYKTLKITRTSDWRTYCIHCAEWIDHSYGNPNGHDPHCIVWREWLKVHR